jgi:glycine cleavage system transcriptional repressor
MAIQSRRTVPHQVNGKFMPYAIDVVSIDHIGIVRDIVNFIHENKIGIQDMHTNTYRANNTDTQMFSLHMTINIPANTSIAGIRGDFMDFCDQLNLDAIMEPVK